MSARRSRATGRRRPLLGGAGALLLALAPSVTLAAGGAAQGTNVPWYLSRATGLVAYLLLFATVVLGLAIRTRALDRLIARWRVTDLHTVLSILVVLFVAVHAGVLLADQFIGYSLVEILVPFATSYRSVWTGFGIIAAWLLLIVAVSFPARRVIGYRAWRALHYGTFFIYIAALVHGLFTGTDTAQAWAQAIYLSTATLMLALVLYRVLDWRQRALAALRRPRPQRSTAPSQPEQGYAWAAGGAGANPARAGALTGQATLDERRATIEGRTVALVLAAAGTAAMIVLAAGFGAFHWGQADAGGSADGATPQGISASAPPRLSGFSEGYAGSVLQGGGRRGAMTLHVEAQGQRPVTLEMQVVPERGGGQGAAYQGSAVLSDTTGATLCTGRLVSFSGSGFAVDCDGAGPYAGSHLSLQGTIDAASGDAFQGNLTVSPSAASGSD